MDPPPKAGSMSKTNTAINAKSLMIFSLALIMLLCFGGLSLLMLRSHSVSQVLVFAIYSFAAIMVISYLVLRLSRSFESSTQIVILLLKTFLAALAGAIILESLTVYGSPKANLFYLGDWSKKRLVVFFVLALICFLALKSFPARFKVQTPSSTRLQPLGVSFIVSTILAVISVALISCIAGNIHLSYFLFSFATVFSVCALINRPRTNLTIEGLFLAIALPFGLATVICMPVTTGLSYDDQIHYSNALDASYLFTSQRTDTDIHFSEIAVRRAQGEDVLSLTDWSSEKTKQDQENLNTSYRADIALGRVLEFNNEPIFTLSTIGYIPSAFGLWLARILGLGFCHTVILGRTFNLLAFLVAFFLAIKITPAKKALFLLVGLIPTNIFLASNYSYDPLLIAMIALGCAMLFNRMWGDRKLETPAKAFPSLMVCSAGIAIKAVYFPVLGLFLLMPKDKFKSKRQHSVYCLMIVLAVMILLVSFALPFLLAGSSNTGDVRGGDGINPMGQVEFILNNPMGYCAMLANYFANTYLSPSYSPSFLLNYAYIGQLGAGYSNTPWIVLYGWVPFFSLLACAIIDGNESSAKTSGPLQTIWSTVLFFSSLTLVATALYVSFTPVGRDTVNGCQARYILPLLIPALACIFNNKYQPILSQNATRLLFTGVALAEIAACSFLLIVPRFFA